MIVKLFRQSICSMCRLIWSNNLNSRLFVLTLIVYLVILISIQTKLIRSNSKSSFENSQLTKLDKNESIIINDRTSTLFLNEKNVLEVFLFVLLIEKKTKYLFFLKSF